MFVGQCGCGEGVPSNDTDGGVLRVRDAIGNEMSFERPAVRIVSLAPNLTELVYAGGAGELLEGRTSYCNYPAAALNVPVVSDLSTPNYEAIIAAKPDVVLMTLAGNSSAVHRKLRDLGLSVFVLATDRVEGIIRTIDTVRLITGMGGDAGTDSLLARVAAVRKRAALRTAPGVLVVIDRAPLVTVSGGFLNEAIAIAGGRNIAAGDPAAYPRFSREAVIQQDPDVILIPDESVSGVGELLASFPEWRGLRAVRTGRVHTIDADLLFRPGPRIVNTIELLDSLFEATARARSVEQQPQR